MRWNLLGSATLFVAALSAVAPASAAAGEVTVGIRGGVDGAIASQSSSQPESVSGDLFVRIFPAPSLAMEATVGYRSASSTRGSGPGSTSFSITQVPVMAGAAWVFSPGSAFRHRIGAGLAVLPTKTRSTTTLAPGREESFETSSTVLGGYAEAGLQARMYENLTGEASLRYVLNPIPQETGRPSSQNYVTAFFGFSARF
jgi:hypothetical protein